MMSAALAAPRQPDHVVFRLTVAAPTLRYDEATVWARDVAPTFGDADVAPLVLDVVGHETWSRVSLC